MGQSYSILVPLASHDFGSRGLTRSSAARARAGQLLGLQVEDVIGTQYECYDYGDYPEFRDSIGFTQRDVD
jgi:hypothetical protein